MATPIPLTRTIADMTLDTMILAEDITEPELRTQILSNLRLINRQADKLHAARLLSRGIEDTGTLTPWQRYKLRQMEQAHTETTG